MHGAATPTQFKGTFKREQGWAIAQVTSQWLLHSSCFRSPTGCITEAKAFQMNSDRMEGM